MNFEEFRKPKNLTQYTPQFQSQNNLHPKSQKLIKQVSSQQPKLTNSPLTFTLNKYNITPTINHPKQLYQEDVNNNSYIISLSQYEDRKSYDSNQGISRGSYDSENERNKRNLIYGNQSYKSEDMNETTIENNNQIFQMVFLNKNKSKIKADYHDDVSTSTGSFAKVKVVGNKKIVNQNEDEQDEEGEGENFIKIDDFTLGRKLGAGKFGQVFIANHKKTGFVCAIKRINKQNIDQKLLIQLIREIKIQTFLNHPNIVKLYTFFCDKQFIYFVLELCYSGQLYNFLKKKRKLQEPLTKNIIQQTLKALDYMHENEIIHRDLKPENIIYQNGLIKLCDFGWSISSKTMRETFCGTPLYVSPELLKRKNYNNKIDVWSIGILTYELLFGRVPFDINTERDFIKIVQDQIKFSKATKISDAAKDFILICLKKDPRERYTVPQLLEHPFIQNQEPVSMADMY